MIKLKVASRQKSPVRLCSDGSAVSIASINKLIELKMQELAKVAKSGLMEDLNIEQDTEIILDCGTVNINETELNNTIV